jgi:NADH-quinone oxidoreductase subunit C
VEPVQIAEALKEKFPDEVLFVETHQGQAAVVMRKDRAFDVLKHLHGSPELSMDHLRDLCGVDYMGKKDPRFEVVYHLYSIKHRHMLRVRVQVPENKCSVKSVVPIWRGADWHERECYDLFGIAFEGHPDLRRILLPEDWEGHPLRKDYPIKGPSPEQDWHGYREVLEKAEQYKEFEWNR